MLNNKIIKICEENNKIMDKYLKEILIEMFNRVNAPIDNIEEFIKQPIWFHTYEWDEDESNEFILWLVDYLGKNKKAFQLLTRSRYNKKNRVTIANQFENNYGWKRKY